MFPWGIIIMLHTFFFFLIKKTFLNPLCNPLPWKNQRRPAQKCGKKKSNYTKKVSHA